MNLFFRLECGRDVALRGLYFQETYIGLLMGHPDREINHRILDEVKVEMMPLWGQRRIHIIPPEIDESNPQHPKLPPVRFTAWLLSYQPIREPSDASELVVVWFRKECADESIEEIVGDAIHYLPWDELAEDFEW